MKKFLIIALFCLSAGSVCSQDYNMLGKTYNDIFEKFNLDPEFYVKVDTIDEGKTVTITCRKSSNYPYYYYEIDPETRECVCFCTVSKDRQVYDACLDLLSIWGKEILADETHENFVFEVKDKTNQPLIYTVKQYNGEQISMRNIFYIYVTRENKQ